MADKYLNLTVLNYYHNRIKSLFADKNEIPTDLSDLTNTGSDPYAQVSDLPTALSDLTNDEGFIDNTVSNLVNYYTTSNTYTKTEVDTLIGQISTISFEIVQSLPSTGQSNIIYLVPNSGSGENVYDEYIWVTPTGGTAHFEKIGSTAVDLSNYWTSTSGQNNSLIAITTAEIDEIITPSSNGE